MRPASACLVLLMALSLGHWPVAAPARPQDATTDGGLEAASNGRLVRVGALSGNGAVTTVPLEVYVARVLVGEAEPNAPDGGLQALAIAARTFTMVNIGRHSREGFDLCDTTHCQVWRAAATAASRRCPTTYTRTMCRGGSNDPSTKCARLWRVWGQGALAWRTSGSRAARPVAG